MRLFDIIYYQAYNFYSEKLNDENPHFNTTWGIGISFSFIIVFTIMGFRDIFYCGKIPTIFLFAFSMVVYWLFLYYFTSNDRRDKIIEEKPLFRNSDKLSRVIAILYFGIAIAMMFIGPTLAHHFYEIYCI